MPRGIPSLGDPSRREQLEGERPLRPEILGTLPNSARTLNAPEPTTTTWTREDGTVVELTEPAPPWESGDDQYAISDARRFVECPPNWRLRWINPKVLASEGWRDWQAVLASDPRVKVRVPVMITPENYIRRGGPQGDILCWMWVGWFESIKLKHRQKTADLTQSAVDNQIKLKDEFARGTYGPYLRVEGAKHPTHTTVEDTDRT